MKGILEILDATHGHVLVEWDTETDTTEAELEFERLKEMNYVAFSEQPDGSFAVVETFDETSPRIILSPQFVGG